MRAGTLYFGPLPNYQIENYKEVCLEEKVKGRVHGKRGRGGKEGERTREKS